MRIRYRIVRNGVEEYRGSATAVRRKLATLSRREDVSKLTVQRTTSTDAPTYGGVPQPGEQWTDHTDGSSFLAS